MHYLYILKSTKDNRLYVGCTSDLKKRLHQHKTGQVESTKTRRPFLLVFCEKFNSRVDAFQKEKYLKSLYGYKTKRKLIKAFGKEISF